MRHQRCAPCDVSVILGQCCACRGLLPRRRCSSHRIVGGYPAYYNFHCHTVEDFAHVPIRSRESSKGGVLRCPARGLSFPHCHLRGGPEPHRGAHAPLPPLLWKMHSSIHGVLLPPPLDRYHMVPRHTRSKIVPNVKRGGTRRSAAVTRSVFIMCCTPSVLVGI